MSWVKVFLHGEIWATQVPWADVAGCSAVPSHCTQEPNSAVLTVKYAGEQSWHRTWWQDTAYPHRAPCHGRSLGNAQGCTHLKSPKTSPIKAGSSLCQPYHEEISHAKGYTNTMQRMKPSHLPARHFRAMLAVAGASPPRCVLCSRF